MSQDARLLCEVEVSHGHEPLLLLGGQLQQALQEGEWLLTFDITRNLTPIRLTSRRSRVKQLQPA